MGERALALRLPLALPVLPTLRVLEVRAMLPGRAVGLGVAADEGDDLDADADADACWRAEAVSGWAGETKFEDAAELEADGGCEASVWYVNLSAISLSSLSSSKTWSCSLTVTPAADNDADAATAVTAAVVASVGPASSS